MRGKGIGLVASGMIAGIFIGSHMVGAIGASAPCGTATPVATKVARRTPTTGKLIAAYSSQQIGKVKYSSWDSPVFVTRDALFVWARFEPLDTTKPATVYYVAVEPEIRGGGIGLGDIALGAGDKPTAIVAHVPKDFCKVGCSIHVSQPANVKWTVTIHTQ